MKNMKKIIALLLIVLVVLTSTHHQTQKTQAAGLTVAFIVAGCLFVGSACLGAAYLSNPDDNKDLLGTMKDFANDTVENQKKLYEIEKANFQMVMNKAVDAGIGTCLVGPNGVHITAKQLQGQQYPEFDTWKGYKEKESQKPSGNLWGKFQLGVELADMLIGLFSKNSGSGVGGSESGDEQLYYTGDDGYIDRETGLISIQLDTYDLYSYPSESSDFNFKYNTYKLAGSATKKDIKDTIRLCFYVRAKGTSYLYEGQNCNGLHRAHFLVDGPYYGVSGSSSFSSSFLYSYNFMSHVWDNTEGIFDDRTFSNDNGCGGYSVYYSCQLNNKYDGSTYVLTDWDKLSCNVPVFDSEAHARAYIKDGSLEGLLNGAPESGPTPTEAPASPSSTVSPVRQYVNYFTNTFSPSVMPYHVNYNIVNNWDGNDSTFNINNYTDVTVPTLTPAPDADGNDTNITNNLIINQVNILTEINETVTNIYNFFQIDVDYINEELKMDEDENPTGFDDLKNLISQFEAAFPSDKVSEVTQELDLLYPKITIQVPKVLDRFLDAGDDKVIMEDGVKKIVLCDFKDYAIYFVRFRKFLEIVLRIGLIFYLLKELTVVFSIA